MNAVFREKDKPPVMSNDAIQAKLNHLQEGVTDVRRSQSRLEDKIDGLDGKMDLLKTSLLEKIDALGKDVLARFEASR